jgi:hypothetical protein
MKFFVHLPVAIHSCHTAPPLSGSLEIVSEDFPVLHAADSACFFLHIAMPKMVLQEAAEETWPDLYARSFAQACLWPFDQPALNLLP